MMVSIIEKFHWMNFNINCPRNVTEDSRNKRVKGREQQTSIGHISGLHLIPRLFILRFISCS